MWNLIFQPKQWQKEALIEWNINRNGIVKVVTGAGKTIFAELCILNYIKNKPDGVIVIVVPTIALSDQWFVSLTVDLNVKENEINCFSSIEKHTKLNKINIFVINTARNMLKTLRQNHEIFLIVDECHRVGSKVNSQILNEEYDATLGLSATPEREFDTAFNDILVPALGPVIYVYDYIRAYEDNIICKFDLSNVKVKFLPDEQEKYDLVSKKIAIEIKKIERGEGSNEKLKILLQQRANISTSAILRNPVAAKIAFDNKNKRIIIFHEKIQSANLIFKILEKRNLSVSIYHSKINPQIRRNNLILFKKGIYKILITCKALDEGLNVPDINLAIIAGSTASTRQRIQRLGRVLRQNHDKESATIYTLYITKQEESSLKREETKMSEIAKVTWLNSTVDKW